MNDLTKNLSVLKEEEDENKFGPLVKTIERIEKVDNYLGKSIRNQLFILEKFNFNINQNVAEEDLERKLSHDDFMDYYWVTDWFISKSVVDFLRLNTYLDQVFLTNFIHSFGKYIRTKANYTISCCFTRL